MHRIYTNEVERERLRQASYAMTPNRLSLNRHRVHRAKPRQLTIIGIVASERKDQTLYDEVRAALREAGQIGPGTRLDQTYDLVESRRDSREMRRGFASNRMIRFAILPERVVPSFPLEEPRAMAAAHMDSLV